MIAQHVAAWSTLALVVITAFYAWQTWKLVRLESERSALGLRPYLEVRFVGWESSEGRGPEFEAFNVGRGPAVRVRFDGRDLAWSERSAKIQGSATIGVGLPPARFSFPTMPATRPGGLFPEGDWHSEFRIRYNDAPGYHEFAEKWRLGVIKGETYLVRVNATTLKVKPVESEDYVIESGSQ